MRLPNGYGTVYKLSGKRRKPWTAVVTLELQDDGRYKRKTLGYYVTRQEGLTALAEYHRDPSIIDVNNITFGEVMDSSIKDREEHGKSFTFQLRSGIKQLKAISSMKMCEVKTRHIQGVIDGCDTISGARSVKLAASMVYKYAIREELADKNYARLTTTPTLPPSTKHKPFSEQEIEELWTHVDDDVVKMALIMIYTGMRPAELVELKNANIFDRYAIGGKKTTAGINRTIPFHDRIIPLINYFRSDNENLMPFKPHSMLYRWKTCEFLKGHLPHDGRHTCETRLNNAEINKRTIQLIIGHAGKDVDDRVYTHKTTEQLIEAINIPK